jgi:hypothetical protein
VRTWATRMAALLACAAFSVLSLVPGCGSGNKCLSLCEESKSRCPEQFPEDATCEESCEAGECLVQELGCAAEYQKVYDCDYDPCAADVTMQLGACPAFGEYLDCYLAAYNSKTQEERDQLFAKCPQPGPPSGG